MQANAAARLPTVFAPAVRINQSLTSGVERRALQWMALRAPRWLTSDQLTLLGFIAVILCLILNWFGDSMDGTLARTRNQQRPRFGFYVDHVVDVFGAIALMCGLACSGLLHWQSAIAMLIAFLLLSSESFLATYTLSRFELSQGLFGPTEIRLLLIAGNLALLRSPYSHVFGHRVLLFDFGGAIAAVCMLATAICLSVRHTAQLYREEPLP
jgi:archaetidylinositol phosphate synthase